MPASLEVARHVLAVIGPACRGLDLTAAGQLTLAAALHRNEAASQQLPAVLQLTKDILPDGHLHPAAGESQHVAGIQHSELWALAAAAVTLLRQPAVRLDGDSTRAHAAQAIATLLLPLLAAEARAAAAAPDADASPAMVLSRRQQELLHVIAELVATCSCWPVGMALLQAATGTEQQQVQQHPLSQGDVAAAAAGLPANVRIQLAAAIVEQALLAAGAGRAAATEQQQQQQQGPEAVLQHAVEYTLPSVLALLAGPKQQQQQQQKGQPRQCQAAQQAPTARVAVQYLMPAVFAAASQQGEQEAALNKLWDACRGMLAGSEKQRQLGLSLLVQLPAGVLAPAVGGLEGPGDEESGACWALLRSCLCDSVAANRKRAAHVLNLAVQQEADGQLAPAWQSFLKLLDCLNERAPHLVKDGWSEIDRLLPTAAATGTPDVAGGSGGSRLRWAWLQVLWTRGLQHEHQQVQRAVLESFLSRRWQLQLAQTASEGEVAHPLLLPDVPPSFVLEVLLPVTGQAHMWHGEGAAALQAETAAWVGRYTAAAASTHERQQLLLALLDLLAGASADASQRPPPPLQQQQLLRPFAQTVAAALVAAAKVVTTSLAEEEEQVQLWRLLFLQRLQRATTSLGSNWGSSTYAADMCGSLVQAAAAAAPLTGDNSCSRSISSQALLSAVGVWLQQLPLPLLLPGGALHQSASTWVQAAGQQQQLTALGSCVREYVATGIRSENNFDCSVAAAAAEWVAWEQQAGGLARLVLLIASRPASRRSSAGAMNAARAEEVEDGASPANLAAALASWAHTLAMLHRRPYLPRGTAERCLLLLSQLLIVCSMLAPTTQQQPAQQRERQPLLDWLVATVCAAADEVASYAGMLAAAALWRDQPQRQQHQQPASERHASRLAHLSLLCVSDSLHMLLLGKGHQVPGAADEAVGHLARCCLEVLQCFAAARHEPDDEQRQMPKSAAEWQHVTAQLMPLTDSCNALARAVEAEQQQGPRAQHQLAGLAEAAEAALDVVLSLQAVSVAATAEGSNSDRATAAYAYRLCWKAVDGLLVLLLQLARAQAEQEQWQQQQQQQRSEEQQAHVLAAALRSLEAEAGTTGPGADSRCLLLQLRCCRRLLPLALEQPHMRQLALKQRRPMQSTAAAAATSADSSDDASAAALVGWLCGAAWRIYEGAAAGSRRRRTGLTAALASTCLHPALFGAAPLALHNLDGPLQQLLGRLLAAGRKSWRVMSIVALQLCGVLTRAPELATCYSVAIQHVLLWGSADDPGQSGMVRLCAFVTAMGDGVNGETAAEVATLIAPGDAELVAAFGATELAPRVAALCMLRSWVEQAQRGDTVAAGQAGMLVWRQLLALSASDPELGAVRYSPLGLIHRKKVRLWQALCVLSPIAPPEQAEQDFEAVLGGLSCADVANVKQYQDTTALVLLRRRPALLRARVLPLLRDCRSSGSNALSSLVLVAARAVAVELRPGADASGQQPAGESVAIQQLLLSHKEQAALLAEAAAAITPWALSHVHALRTFAQLVLWRLYEVFPSLHAADPAAASLLHFFRENEDVGRLRRGLSHAFYFDSFDLDQAVTPAGMLCKGTSVHRADVSFEGAPQSLLEEVQEFLLAERQHLRQELWQSKVAVATSELAAPAQQSQPPPAASSSSNWQKKGGGAGLAALPPAAAPGGAWAAALGTAALLSGGLDAAEVEMMAAEEAAAACRGGPRQQLLVVASLLTKAPNLAGLARTCEVFRASGLVLPDLAATKLPEFKSIAVTAHHWLPLIEVREAMLGAWLQRQAAQGWTLVGLEQSAESVQLQDFRFPRRTVLVLGREKEGIPADLLGLMHHTVEIPQLGLIRSLNVHVSGALAVFEYTRQAMGAAAAAGSSGSDAQAPRRGD